MKPLTLILSALFYIGSMLNAGTDTCLAVDPTWDQEFGAMLTSQDLTEAIIHHSGDLLIAGTGDPDIPSATVIGSLDGNNDAYVMRLDRTNGTVVFATRLGGFGEPTELIAEPDGSFHLFFTTDNASLPTSIDAYDDSHNGSLDIFHLILDDDGLFVYGSYIGGSDQDGLVSGFRKNDGRLILAGYTASSDFPVSAGAYDETFNGVRDILVLSIDTDKSLAFATFLGGDNYDTAADMAWLNDRLYLAGSTYSTDFPVTMDAYGATYSALSDGAYAVLSNDGTQLHYATYIGGSGNDNLYNVAVTSTGDAMVAGITSSANLPTNAAVDTTYGGSIDAFAASFHPDNSNRFVSYYSFYDYIPTDSSDRVYGLWMSQDQPNLVYGQGTIPDELFQVDVRLVQLDLDGTITCEQPSFQEYELGLTVVPDGEALFYAGKLSGFPEQTDIFVRRHELACNVPGSLVTQLEGWQEGNILSLVTYVNETCL